MGRHSCSQTTTLWANGEYVVADLDDLQGIHGIELIHYFSPPSSKHKR